MKIEAIYKEISEAKNGSLIPLLKNGSSIESKYNPERDAENLLALTIKTDEDENKDFSDEAFFVVLGTGSGIFIQKLADKYTNAKIITLEATAEDLQLIKSIPAIKELGKSERIIFSTIENLHTTIISNYIPALHGNLRVIEQKAWCNVNSQLLDFIKKQIELAVQDISADFSVQSHFGKIWQFNILANLKHAENQINRINPETDKTAVIVAAGPSLDKKIEALKSRRNELYIIATDTAFSVLSKKGINADAVVSIDGQSVSFNHFFTRSNTAAKDTHFLFDLCANSSAVNHIISKGFNVSFFVTGHPLSLYADSFSDRSFLKLYSGAGTVTITAIDFAVKSGFKNIEVYGADFSYSNGKAYTKGTYLDALYSKFQSRIKNSQTDFDRLMFRTELEKLSEKRTSTQTLLRYKESLLEYLKNNGLSFTDKDEVYFIKNNSKSKLLSNTKAFNYELFLASIKTENPQSIKQIFLPYIAWLRKNKKYKNYSFNEFLKLAYSSFVSYNK